MGGGLAVKWRGELLHPQTSGRIFYRRQRRKQRWKSDLENLLYLRLLLLVRVLGGASPRSPLVPLQHVEFALVRPRSLREEHSRGEQDYSRHNAISPRRILIGAAGDPKTHVAKSEPEYVVAAVSAAIAWITQAARLPLQSCSIDHLDLSLVLRVVPRLSQGRA